MNGNELPLAEAAVADVGFGRGGGGLYTAAVATAGGDDGEAMEGLEEERADLPEEVVAEVDENAAMAEKGAAAGVLTIGASARGEAGGEAEGGTGLVR